MIASCHRIDGNFFYIKMKKAKRTKVRDAKLKGSKGILPMIASCHHIDGNFFVVDYKQLFIGGK